MHSILSEMFSILTILKLANASSYGSIPFAIPMTTANPMGMKVRANEPMVLNPFSSFRPLLMLIGGFVYGRELPICNGSLNEIPIPHRCIFVSMAHCMRVYAFNG